MIKESSLIAEFKQKLVEYNEIRLQKDTSASQERLQELRQWLNRHIPLVTVYAAQVGISTSIYHSPAPAIGA